MKGPERLRETLRRGVELPDGRILTFGPSRECPCVDCTEAFEALEEGTLVVHPAGSLPW